MIDATTNLADIVADRVLLWDADKKSHESCRTIFVNNSQIKPVTRIEQIVGDEIDVVLVFDGATNNDVPALSDLVEYIEQERLGTGATVNKHYNINRTNVALIQDTEVIARRGRHGPVGNRGPRGAAGKAQNVTHEGDIYAMTKSAPSIRGRQEMVLCQGDTHLSRITKHREVKQSVVNHVETQHLNVTKHAKQTKNELLHFHEGDRTTIRNHNVNRKTVQNIEVYAPVTAYRRPKQVVDRHVNIEVFAPVFLQRNINITKVRRNIIIFTPA
jgi:hypothetical protein